MAALPLLHCLNRQHSHPWLGGGTGLAGRVGDFSAVFDRVAPVPHKPVSCARRALDLGLTLPVLLPLVFLIAVMLRLTSKGPAVFIQARIGRKGPPFGMIKFRSMHRDAKARGPKVWTAWG